MDNPAACGCKGAPLERGVWRHYKGNLYRVLDEATHSETLEPMVIYQALYGSRGLWVRPRSMFLETVTVDGRSQPRFAYLGESEPEA